MYKIFRYWIPVFFVLSSIFYLSSLPAKDLPHFGFLDFPYSDKAEHFIIYSFLGFFVCRAATAKRRSEPDYAHLKKAIWFSVAFGLLYGISDEFHQSFVPGRAVDVLDATADTLGTCLGAFVALFYRKWLVKKALV